MTQEQRDELLLCMHQDIKSLKQDVKVLQEDNKSIKQDIKTLQEDNKSIKQDIKTLQEDNKSIKQDIKTLQEDNKSIKQDIKILQEENASISRSVARIEVVHGGNIQALLDGQSAILEKLNLFEKRFESDEKDLENHSSRIWKLESKVGIV